MTVDVAKLRQLLAGSPSPRPWKVDCGIEASNRAEVVGCAVAWGDPELTFDKRDQELVVAAINALAELLDVFDLLVEAADALDSQQPRVDVADKIRAVYFATRSPALAEFPE